jgi:hypothetical protein
MKSAPYFPLQAWQRNTLMWWTTISLRGFATQ